MYIYSIYPLYIYALYIYTLYIYLYIYIRYLPSKFLNSPFTVFCNSYSTVYQLRFIYKQGLSVLHSIFLVITNVGRLYLEREIRGTRCFSHFLSSFFLRHWIGIDLNSPRQISITLRSFEGNVKTKIDSIWLFLVWMERWTFLNFCLFYMKF